MIRQWQPLVASADLDKAMIHDGTALVHKIARKGHEQVFELLPFSWRLAMAMLIAASADEDEVGVACHRRCREDRADAVAHGICPSWRACGAVLLRVAVQWAAGVGHGSRDVARITTQVAIMWSEAQKLKRKVLRTQSLSLSK